MEDSKAACAVAGDACISIAWHGQTGVPAAKQAEQSDECMLKEWNPAISKDAIEAELNEHNWEAL